MLKVYIFIGLLAFSYAKHHHDDDEHDHDDDDEHHSHAPNGETRLCPDGYEYAGDDTPKLTKDFLLEEAYRSPTYSCYKINSRSPKPFLKAAFECEEDKGNLVSFEDREEIKRFQTHFIEEKKLKNITMLTSAMNVEKTWVWTGSNKSEAQEMLKDIEASESQSCLAMIGEWEELPVEMEFKTISCFEPNNYVCEVRVQTVTYYAWFIANWFSVLMVFLVFILMISLCMSLTMNSRRSRHPGRAYRASGHVFNDQPPSYNRATGNTRINRYVNRGREFLARANPSQNEKARMANTA